MADDSWRSARSSKTDSFADFTARDSDPRFRDRCSPIFDVWKTDVVLLADFKNSSMSSVTLSKDCL